MAGCFVDSVVMTAVRDGPSTCAQCGAVLEGDRAFCRLYQGAERVLLCAPKCAQDYLLISHCNGSSRPGASVVEEIVTEWRWREHGW